MSTLVVNELYDGVVFEQNIVVDQSISVSQIRVWIYKQGTIQDGQLRLEVYDGATLLKTVNIDYTEINENITGTYAHGYIRFNVFPLGLNVGETEENHTYTFKWSMENHTSDVNNYIAICREWEQRKYPIYGDDPSSDLEEPAGYELYVYRG